MTIINNRKIVIFSEPFHANKIANLYGKKDAVIIAFSVEGKVALEKIGIQCYFPDELIEIPDLNQIGINNYKRVKKICLFLDDKFKERVVFLRENRIDIFSASFFWIKVFFDSLYTSYFILEKLFNEINNKEVIVFRKPYHFDKIFLGKDNLIPPLMENVFLERYKNIKIVHDNNIPNSLEGNLRITLGNVKRLLPSFIFKGSRFKANGIVLDNRFDVDYVISDILSDIKFYKIFASDYFIAFNSVNASGVKFKKTPVGKDGYDELIVKFFAEMVNEPIYLNLFDGNRAIFNFWNKCLEEYLLKSLGYLLASGTSIKEMLIDMSPEMLITASCRVFLNDTFILEIARSLNIPIITYQEGGGFGYLDLPLFEPDINQSDYFIAYGKGVKESPFLKQKDKVIPAGSIYLSKLKKQIKNRSSVQKYIYVVLDNLKTTPYQHYPYNGGSFSQTYIHQIKIINLLRQFENIYFVLKTINENELLYNSFVDDKFIKIETKPLSKVLDDASAFILEYPSTVLQECLATDKPIALLYNKSAVKFESRAYDLLSRRVRMTSDSDEFPEIIRLLINDTKYGSNMTENNEFRDRYCLMNNTEENLKMFFNGLLEKR